jgi:hypothetical protein
MKSRIQFPVQLLRICGLFLLLLAASSASLAQGAARGPISAPRDAELEKQSYHNLEVAKYYFYKRKPTDKNDKEGWARLNKAVIDRLQEILDTNPNFARLDSVYQLLATAYTRDSQNDKALECWSIIVKDFPDSEHIAEAKKRLGPTVETDKKDGKTDSKPEQKG